MHHNIAIITLIASANALMLESKLEAKFLGKIGEIGEAILEGGEEAGEFFMDEAKMPAEYVKYQTDYIENMEPLAKMIEEQRADKAAKCSDAKPAVGEKFWENGTGLVNFT